MLVVYAINSIGLRRRRRAVLLLDPLQQRIHIGGAYDVAIGMLLLTALLVWVFYCLDALYGERRDRSILFWKSLPVSDLATVLSKTMVPFVILPLLTVVLAAVAHAVMLLLSSAVLMASGQGPGTLWAHVSLPEMWLMLLYHMVTAHILWYAPIYGWLLFVSAWARRAPWLWAILPPLAVGVVERIAFGSSVLGDLLSNRSSGAPGGTEFTVRSE